MPTTPILNKPISYGSPTLDTLFLALVIIHVIPGVFAPISAIVALSSKKGQRTHLLWGKIFVRSMWALATTGIVLDVVRLGFHVAENHTKYPGLGMPSSYPARLAFLYMAACLFYLLRVCVPPDVFDFARRKQSRDRTWAVGLMTLGATLTVLIVLKYNPWSGALWSIWTFMGVCWFIAEKRRGVADRPSAVALHRWGMGFLGGFSFWGALQGFVPGIVMALRGPDMSDKPYVGNLPGKFSPFFFVFLFGWTVPIAIGMFIAHRSGLKARQRRPQAG